MDKRRYRIDPREVTGTYWSAYWRREYKVLGITRYPNHDMRTISVEWQDGTRTTHQTPWDWQRDRVVHPITRQHFTPDEWEAVDGPLRAFEESEENV